MTDLQPDNECLRGDLRTIGRRFAHDLRTPLNCLGNVGDALADSGAETRSAAEGFAQSISDSVAESTLLIERVTFVVMATANPPPLRPVRMEEIVWGALQRLEARTLKAAATIIRPPAWPIALGVPAWIDFIWTNLLANSLRHAGPAPRIELGSDPADRAHRFWIRDSGGGVAPAQRERLFHPFNLLHELNAPRGYGLPLVRRLVELQGGRCGYDPDPAPGGTFHFTLRTA
jgi:light-regulated signal transduction histidine kinase (bacteriophytochrome)